MFSRWLFLSALSLVLPSLAWSDGASSDFSDEVSSTEQSDPRAEELFAEFTRLHQATKTGEPQALFNLGAYFYQHQNYAGARKWWGKAAEAGLARAQIQLAMLYRDGDGGPQDKAEAARWFARAAEQGDAGAQNEMGVLYWSGEGVDKDRVKAGIWFERAAKAGSEDAETNLGWFYLDDSQGVYGAASDEEAALLDRYAASREKAFQWFCKAATRGSARAQFKVGEAYWNGAGAGMNKLQARLWLEKAAQQQDAEAIAWLKTAEDAAWYTRLENWGHAALDGELSGTADCSGAPDRRHANRGVDNASPEPEAVEASAADAAEAVDAAEPASQ
ncbi:tetratricopeptide repeat protein [Pseudomonas sp. PDM22]|uniref:tetratricopeptide repeat protein n=1 Tax=Pseudomonas sp. PDM22 TaxID=2769287 RepID=UPI00177E5A1C|nr:tetratricopeptide repeat protein [Pseudomonas sp. PDM22]MBD9514588.1 sel1 repeat family protein [Pseudomonas sp. PDM22]